MLIAALKAINYLKESRGYKALDLWLTEKGWKLAGFQQKMITTFSTGKSGLLNAPTGSGKTYGLWFPVLIKYLNDKVKKESLEDLQVLWITPLRALSKDLQRNMQLAADGLKTGWKVGIRTGDISSSERTRQKRQMPQTLIITPESLHQLFTQKNQSDLFKHVHTVVVDEWHELLASKRGVQTELALAHLKGLNPNLQVWGISATIGNMNQAMEVLLGANSKQGVIVTAGIHKKIKIKSLLPPKIESLPWAGYLGVNMLEQVMKVVAKSKTTLLFTNTRSQTEIWYRFIMQKHPEMAGLVALHHGSLGREIRDWVENALHEGKLKLVICTSSLDLGVDFRPVETVIQVGSPKSISRFVQRAGRSGHSPDQTSTIYFVPTHALELIEGVSLREGVKRNILENREPVVQAFDVLVQWMVTLAIGGGFDESNLFEQVKKTYAYQFINRLEWEWLLSYITTGSQSLYAYDEFKKAEIVDGLFVVNSQKVAMRHRLSIGTIVSEQFLKVKLLNGKYLGSVEEGFGSRLNSGDIFWFAGLSLEFVQLKNMEVSVRKAEGKKGIVPQWLGGRMPLSSSLSVFIRENLAIAKENPGNEEELKKLQPLFDLQTVESIIPKQNELLIEQCKTKEGYHIFVFPFEGRLVHEGMAALLAYRLSLKKPITFSIAMNDYGFELLSDQYTDIGLMLAETDLFDTEDLLNDIYRSVNATEMAQRKFREIASISGLTFHGYPGKAIKASHLQASSSLLFNVLYEYEKDNLLVKQAFSEVFNYQLEEKRMRDSLERIAGQAIIIKHVEKPTPFAFPILVDRLREQLSSEKLEERISRMIKEYEAAN